MYLGVPVYSRRGLWTGQLWLELEIGSFEAHFSLQIDITFVNGQAAADSSPGLAFSVAGWLLLWKCELVKHQFYFLFNWIVVGICARHSNWNRYNTLIGFNLTVDPIQWRHGVVVALTCRRIDQSSL